MFSKFRICPFLGQRDDKDTALSYPSVLNCCSHTLPVTAIDFEHQEEFCLSAKFLKCERYLVDPGNPSQTVIKISALKRSFQALGDRKWLWGIYLLVLGIIIALQFISQGSGFGKTPPQTGMTRLMQTNTNQKNTDTNIPLTETANIPITISLTPTSTSSVTPRPLLSLDTPLGIDHKFMIYQIKDGDSLDRIAGKHGTTVVALLSVNYRLHSPLIAGWAIVVPLFGNEAQSLPSFEVFSVTQPTTLSDLAIQLSVDQQVLMYYNALDEKFLPSVGDWLLVPRAGLSTPTDTPFFFH